MHLDVGLTFPQTLLLVHVGRHLPPLLALLVLLILLLLLVLLVLLLTLLVLEQCIYTRRTHPPGTLPRERERAVKSMQEGLVWKNPTL